MADEKDPPQVHGYLFGKLSPEEEAVLAQQALEDQDVFNALWAVHDDRELLQNPEIRVRLQRRLEDRPATPWWHTFVHWFQVPGGRLAFAGAAVLAIVLAVVYLPRKNNPHGPGSAIEQTLSLVTNANTDLTVLFNLPSRNPGNVGLTLTPAGVFRPGDLVRAGVHLPEPAAVFVLRRRSGAPATLVYPAELATSADHTAGDFSFAFDPAAPTEDIQNRQSYTVRLLAAPIGTDVRTQSIDWAKLGAAYSVAEKSYDVVP